MNEAQEAWADAEAYRLLKGYPEKVCKNCRFFIPNEYLLPADNGKHRGKCRFKPPLPGPISAALAMVPEDWFCGEFQPKFQMPPENALKLDPHA